MLGFTNSEISEVLAIPITQVEHYFRTDKYFAIPSPDVWKDLSALLQISDKDLDSQINSVEEVLGKFDMSERHYLASGLSPTITAAGEIKIIYATHSF